MARQRSWEGLSPTTQRRYLSSGKSQGMTPAQVQAYYSTGGSLGAFRGHKPREGISEYRMRKLTQAAKGLTFGHYDTMRRGTVPNTPGQVVRDALARGMTPDEIARLISDRQRAQNDATLGRRNWGRRDPRAEGPSLSLYWYH